MASPEQTDARAAPPPTPAPTPTPALAQRYLRLVEDAIARGDADPFVNPVLVTAIAVARDLEDGALPEDGAGGARAPAARRRVLPARRPPRRFMSGWVTAPIPAPAFA